MSSTEKRIERPAFNIIRTASAYAGQFVSNISTLLEGKAIYFVAGACVMVFLARLAFINYIGGAPPGSDPGNWLAFSKQLFGSDVKAATATYPPVIPFMVWALDLFLPEMVSITLLGMGISIAIGLVFYIVFRYSVSSWWAAIFAIAAIFLGYSLEMWAWGGYPQLLAQTLFVLSLYFTANWLQKRRQRFFWLAVTSSALAIGTSSMAIPLLAIGLPITGLIIIRQGNLSLATSIRRLVSLIIVTIGASLVFLPWYIQTFRFAQDQIWNPAGYSWQTINQAFVYAFRDWSPVFSESFVLLPLGILTSAYFILVKRTKPIPGVMASAIILTSLIVFLFTFEIRTLAVFQIGLFAGVTVWLYDLYLKIYQIPRLSSIRILPSVLIFIVPILIISQGNSRFIKDLNWYQVVDKPVSEALDYLKDQQDRGVVVAQGNPKGNFYLWWIEGYSLHPAFTTSDPMWLNFKEERDQASIARKLFTSSISDIEAIANQFHIRYIFLDKGMDDDIHNLLNAGFYPVFENERIVILRMGLLLEQPAPDWWPSDFEGMDRLNDLVPPRPAGSITEQQADYYRVWYMKARITFASVLGLDKDGNNQELFQNITKMSPTELWEDIDDLRTAEEIGITGDPRYPSYYFNLWKSIGKPQNWPPESLSGEIVSRITPPKPPHLVSTEEMKEWYKWNRAKLAIVYYGAEDSDPEMHDSWANQYDDLNLYIEIMEMREAFSAGVIGSPDKPFKAFNEWKQKAVVMQ